MAKVTTIPATISRFTATPINEKKKRRTAAYARVSTDSEEQLTSYSAQVDYYTNYIKSRDDWEFVSVYTDEGITGTNTKHREGLQTHGGGCTGWQDRPHRHQIGQPLCPKYGRQPDHGAPAQGKKAWRSILRKKTSGPWTARANCSSPSCPHWRRRKAAAFQRTVPGDRENGLLTGRSPCHSNGFSAMIGDPMAIWF